MPTPTPKNYVFTGARARLSIDGVVVGYAENCSGGEEITYEPIVVLDNIQVAEHVAVGYNVTFTAGRVRLIGETLRGPTLSVFPKLGQGPEEHLRNILDLGELVVQIEDPYTGSIFMILEQAKVASHNWTIGPRSIVGENIVFVAIRMKDESEA